MPPLFADPITLNDLLGLCGGSGGATAVQGTTVTAPTAVATTAAQAAGIASGAGGNGSSSSNGVNNLLLGNAATAAAAAVAATGDCSQLSNVNANSNAVSYAPLTPSSTQSSASPGTKSSFDYFQVSRAPATFTVFFIFLCTKSAPKKKTNLSNSLYCSSCVSLSLFLSLYLGMICVLSLLDFNIYLFDLFSFSFWVNWRT